ncbi:Crp/Fnr family transcriptional regulator [Neorhizobium sp. LjRoot104]|uniref:Crp/Fnr family transcriptional regulator n=1 Tax=Neorhizobium sp. LjRoot104 TaxID=3342254 RepID=UPI003ECD2B57
MISATSLNTKNCLLTKLPREAVEIIEPLLAPVILKQNDVLFEAFRPIEYVYFFDEGLSSEIAVNKSQRIEVGCIGGEGLSGLPAILGVDRTPHRSFMQVGGRALRIKSSDLLSAMERSGALRQLLLRYAHVFMIQVAATALANGRYHVNQRLARWLLMCHDRLGDQLPLTHDFLALMLGVRRPSVTDALHILEGEHLIRAGRSLISVRDRSGLELAAGEAYGIPEREYRRLIGSCGGDCIN